MTLEEQILQRGEQRGIQQGLEQGLERGARVAKMEDARKLRDHGVAWAIITDATGVTPADLGD